MYILEVSYGCPSKKYPLNGIFQMDQTRALAKNGHKVVFTAIDIRSFRRWRKWGIYEHECDSIPVIEYNFPVGPYFLEFGKRISKLGFRKVLKRVVEIYGKPDIVHVHFFVMAECIVDACISEGIRFVITEHSSLVNRDDLSKSEIERMKKVYCEASSVIAVSTALAERIECYTGVKATVIPNIVDLSKFYVDRKIHNGFNIVAAGNLNKGKGFDVLLDAFAKCCDIYDDLSLEIMGDGPEKEKLEMIAKENGIDSKVFFYGKYLRHNFAEELSKSDLFVLTSRGETFGVVYAEALACGVPVIATRCGGPQDFINESNGVLISIDDVDGLVKAVINMRRDIIKYDPNRISSEIYNLFSESNIAERISSVLKKQMSNTVV